MDDKNGFCPQKKSETFCSDPYQKIDKLEIDKLVLQSENKKLKETIITLQLKINKLTLIEYGCSEDSE
jgi:hypothetical protein